MLPAAFFVGGQKALEAEAPGRQAGDAQRRDRRAGAGNGADAHARLCAERDQILAGIGDGGAMVTLRQLEEHAGLAAYTHGAVKEALRHIVGVQLRNLATVGGSIYSRFGFSDVLTMFLAMDCDVELYKGGILPLQEYAQRPYDRDILVRLIIKKTPMQLYYQSVRNSQTDIPVLTCAAARMETGDYRIVIGARPLRAVRFELPAEPALAAEQLAAQFAEGVKAQIVTGSNMRGSAEYRRHLAGVLTKRAVLELEQRKMQEEK